MPHWSVEIVDAADAELEDLPEDMQGRFFHISEMLESFGPAEVGMPHVRHLEGELWEMRMRGRDGIARAIYFSARGRRLVVVRVFVKKTEKTPRREIDLAHTRAQEFKDGEKAQRR
jgi:phage-related protein